MKKNLARLLVLSLLLPIAACSKKMSPPETPASSKNLAATSQDFAPVRQTSFDEVSNQLDAGGDLFVYLSADRWLSGLSTNLSRFRDAFIDAAEVEPGERERVDRGLRLLAAAVKGSGVESLTGVGVSSVQVTPELHRVKLVLHRQKGQEEGLLWNVLGKEPHALSGMDLLTTNTVFAAFGDLELKAIWSAMEDGLRNSGDLELGNAVKQWPRHFEQKHKVSWQELLKSLGGEIGIVLTFDSDRNLDFPLKGKALSIPEPGLLIAVKVNDDSLYDWISSGWKKSPQVKVIEEKGLKMCTMELPSPLQMNLQLTAASSRGYFLMATSPALVRDALAVRDGRSAGLRKSVRFEDLAKYLPAEGNQFIYVDQRLSTTFRELQQQVLKSGNMSAGQAQFIEKLVFGREPAFGLSVGGQTDTGWRSVTVGNRAMSTTLLAAPAVPAGAMVAAMALPALSQAKAKAQSINCMNNMKQQGLAFRMWAMDHRDSFPFNVSTTKGGTMELCNRDSDGFDRNSFRHFQIMSNELNTPKILICPGDTGKHAARDFAHLEPANVSYQVHSGNNVNESNPDEVLVYCPVHHHKGYADGSVRQEDKNRPPRGAR